MATTLQVLREHPRACQYLPGREASLDLRVMTDVSAAELEALLERGWRRFGPTYFRPACATCTACESLRIVTNAFHPTASQRRARRHASPLVRQVSRPVVDTERLELYARWHRDREAARGWDPNPMNPKHYALDFAFPHESVREVTFRTAAPDDRLVGVGIVDQTPHALSAVYFFWDPAHAPASLGVAHIVMLVEQAAAAGLAHVYLGYRVSACPSLAYKGRFGAHELLEGRPGEAGDPPRWYAPRASA